MAKTALIWGASGGIGRAIAQLLVKQGWQVAAAGRNISALGDSVDVVCEADISDAHSVQAAVTALSQQIDAVDWWVYAAGDITAASLSDMAPAVWERILAANLTGVYLTAHFSLPLLADDAALFVLGAVSERMRLPGLGAYAAAKAGVEALGEVMRKELRRPVVVVRPKAVQTALWEKVPFKPPPGAMAPEDLALRMWEAYQAGYKDSQLDI